MPISLQPATLADAPTLSRIFGDAFATDRHTQLKMAGKGPEEMINGMQVAIESWLNKPDRCTVTKAVEEDTDAIMGWVCWGQYGYERKRTEGEEQPDQERKESQEQPPPPPSENATMTPLEELETITNADMQRWMDEIMPDGSKCRYIVSIVVHPSFQKRGVGSALIKIGTEKAKYENVYCWVHSSQAGYRLFERHHFSVEDTLQVDLDKYATLPPPDGSDKWGNYTFRYMVRHSGASAR
jgi:GNAT superfamily N-acetyltransferase